MPIATGLRETDALALALITENQLRGEATARLERALAQRTTALEQRDLLLREVYHRVKNNLQLVDGLMAMQIAETRDATSERALSELRRRVYALGLVHQQLMTSPDLKTFDISTFLHQLAENIMAASGNESFDIRVDAIALTVTLDFAIPLGLLVNELVTNCVKHAVPGCRTEIFLTLCRNAGDDVLLIVSVTRPAVAAVGASSPQGRRGRSSLQGRYGHGDHKGARGAAGWRHQHTG